MTGTPAAALRTPRNVKILLWLSHALDYHVQASGKNVQTIVEEGLQAVIPPEIQRAAFRNIMGEHAELPAHLREDGVKW
jgi:hypothetical protein